jgi:acetyltransferase-like isoleucine patch superfamily enzyme
MLVYIIVIFKKANSLKKFLVTYFYLKCKKVQFGERPMFTDKLPILTNKGKIIIGNNLFVRCVQFKTHLSVAINGELIIGNMVYINEGVKIYASNKVIIGDFSRIADLTCIYDTNFHEVNEREGVDTKPVFIGKNVWIGRNCMILPGVIIGDHSVIAAGSIVNKSIPPKSLVAGNPAKVIRKINCSNNYIRG